MEIEIPSYLYEQTEILGQVFLLPLDLGAIPEMRLGIQSLVRQRQLGEEDSFHLLLVVDELVTNAMIATFNHAPSEKILLHIRLSPQWAGVCVLDYGGGFDLSDTLNKIPDGGSLREFMVNLQHYKNQSGPGFIPYNKRIVEHPRFGRGLRIVAGLVSSLTLVFHGSDLSFSDNRTDNTRGTLVKAIYDLRGPILEN